jgi:hypothetical protein
MGGAKVREISCREEVLATDGAMTCRHGFVSGKGMLTGLEPAG